MSELDYAKALFSDGHKTTLSSETLGESNSETSIRYGTAISDSVGGRVGVLLDGSGVEVSLSVDTIIKSGDRVTVMINGGIYKLVSMTGINGAISAQEKELLDFGATVNEQILGLSNTLDGKVETFFYAYQPTAGNEPAAGWTGTEKVDHTGDLFFNTATGFCHRWTGASWDQITDSRITEAMTTASKAADTADSKRRVFTSRPVSPYDVGDLWVTSLGSGDLKACRIAEPRSGLFYDNDWVLATNYTDDSSVDAVVASFSISKRSVTVTKQRPGGGGTISSSSQQWWVFHPTNNANAPTMMYMSIPVGSVVCNLPMGSDYWSDAEWVVPWPYGIGNLTSQTLPECFINCSCFGDVASANSWSRDTRFLGPVVVTRSYSGTIQAARLELFAVTRT